MLLSEYCVNNYNLMVCKSLVAYGLYHDCVAGLSVTLERIYNSQYNDKHNINNTQYSDKHNKPKWNA